MKFEAKHAIQNAVNAILNNEPDARKAIDSGGRAIYIHEATDTEGNAPDIKVTLIIDNATPADYFENEDGEIFDEEDVVDQNFQTLGGNKYMLNTHMLMSCAYERMGLENPPKNIAAKPILSFILETLGHLPEEDESFVYENFEITAKTVVDGRVSEVIFHILDEKDLLQKQGEEDGEEADV